MPARTSTSPRRSSSLGNKKKLVAPKLPVPAPKPLDVLFSCEDVVRSVAIPPNIAVKVAESASTLYAANAPPPPGGASGRRRSGSPAAAPSMKDRNKAHKARSSLQEALESIDSDVVARMHHANLVTSTFANQALTSTKQTLQQYVGLFQGAKAEAAKLETEMDERDREAVRVVDFLRQELEQKHIYQQKLIQDHRVELAQQKDEAAKETASLKAQLKDKELAVGTLNSEISRLQGELDQVAEFRREKIQLQHENARHAAAEEELTQKFEREITALKFQNLEDRLRLRAVETQMCDKFQEEVHNQASKLVDAKGRAIRLENEELRSHTMRLHSEVEELATQADERSDQLQHTQREVELSLQTQGEYARRGLVQSRLAKDSIEKVKQLQSELSNTVREAKKTRQKDKQAHAAEIMDLEGKIESYHASLAAHRRDLLKTRALAKRIVSQRSELEQFFYDALEYVAVERSRDEQQQQQQQQQNAPGTASSSNNNNGTTRKTMTGDLRALPDPVRKVVSARRDLGYRGDLDAQVVPVEQGAPHGGLHAQSARRPPQGCFSAQSDFIKPRSSQVFLTQPNQHDSVDYAIRQAAAESATNTPRSSSARQQQRSVGVLLEARRQAENERAQQQQQQQQQQQNGGGGGDAHDDDNDNNGAAVPRSAGSSGALIVPAPPSSSQQQQRSMTASSGATRGSGSDAAYNVLPSSSQSSHQQNAQHRQQHQQKNMAVSEMYPEMHEVMKDSQFIAADFRKMSWYDKEKIICAMLHHLNRATLQSNNKQQSSGSAEGFGDDDRSRRVVASSSHRQGDDDNEFSNMQSLDIHDDAGVDDEEFFPAAGADDGGGGLSSQGSSAMGSRVGTTDRQHRLSGGGSRGGRSNSRGGGQPHQQQQQQQQEPISWDSNTDGVKRSDSIRQGPRIPPRPPVPQQVQQQQQHTPRTQHGASSSSGAAAAAATPLSVFGTSAEQHQDARGGSNKPPSASPRPATQGGTLPPNAPTPGTISKKPQ